MHVNVVILCWFSSASLKVKKESSVKTSDQAKRTKEPGVGVCSPEATAQLPVCAHDYSWGIGIQSGLHVSNGLHTHHQDQKKLRRPETPQQTG